MTTNGMKMMRLPVPLNALRAFEVAARHLSIKDAAQELSVTPSAVSHQLRILEASLGFDLMRRTGAGLELTEAGRALAPELTEGFSRIAQAVGTLRRERAEGPLRVSMLPTFANHWLSPRLANYPFERTGCELVLSTSQFAVDLAAGAADAAIRHGKGHWADLHADLLFAETVGLLGHPARFAEGEALRARLARTNLFLSQHRRRNFAAWNETLPGGPIEVAGTTIVDSAGLALRAAIDGAGVTLAGIEIAEADIAAGRLALLMPHRVTCGGYYLVYADGMKRDRRLRSLREWLLAERAAPQSVASPSQ
ncbi:LysR substrate-binding domain-containing protein [Acuticoccus sp. M5D2P5]|uniref:LysR substrate-binding domain-containing protein n=1 Tax=Acuticoccus kalidii TaxID=2910977 RepID=UPI001F2494FA|nr:LysR substrate-binding domain-containing protein [Acuticoccus kalidii]MCF3935719.1 LysR substrate-binding domain-containing protein [Acuticoccus kalidii]